jgi:hypothetical protein
VVRIRGSLPKPADFKDTSAFGRNLTANADFAILRHVKVTHTGNVTFATVSISFPHLRKWSKRRALITKSLTWIMANSDDLILISLMMKMSDDILKHYVVSKQDLLRSPRRITRRREALHWINEVSTCRRFHSANRMGGCNVSSAYPYLCSTALT